MKPYYQDEAVTIYHGDCRLILPELPKVDLVLTDRQKLAPSMLYSEHENQSERRMEAQGGRAEMAETKARNRVAVSRAELVAGSDRGLLCGISNGNDKGVQAPWDWQSGERSSGEAKRKVQGRIAEYDVSLNDSERQVLALSDHGESSHSPQELQPSGQSLRESSSAVQSVSYAPSQNRVVEASKVLCLTDPPYGISHSSSYGASWENTTIQGDSDTSLRDSVLAAFEAVIAFGTWKTAPIENCKGVLVWDKGPASGMGDLRFPWKMSWELIYVRGDNFRHVYRDEGVLRGHIVPTWETSHRFHPHQKPVSLLKYLMQRAEFAETILDPFMGSGTTLRAAKDLGRKAIGIEIEERYCEIAAKRMSQSVLDFTSPDGAGRGDLEPTQEGFFASLS